MLEPINVQPVQFGSPLTDWFNNDLIKPLPRYVSVHQTSEEVEVPVYVTVRGKRMKSTELKFFRNALGLSL